MNFSTRVSLPWKAYTALNLRTKPPRFHVKVMSNLHSLFRLSVTFLWGCIFKITKENLSLVINKNVFLDAAKFEEFFTFNLVYVQKILKL